MDTGVTENIELNSTKTGSVDTDSTGAKHKTPTSDQTPPSELLSADNTLNEDLVRTQNQLATLEGLVDAYDDGIGELSLEIGTLLASTGQTDDALSAFRRALHVSRINYGLDSTRQLPVLEAMVDVQTQANQIESAGDTLNRIYRVHQENYLPDDPSTIHVLTRIGIWHLSAYFFKIDSQRLAHLIKARRALGLAHNATKDSNQGYNFDLYNLLAMTDHGLATIANSSNNEVGNYTGGSQVTVSTIIGSYRRGKLLLETGVSEALALDDTDSLVRAILLYADWNQIFNKRHAARKLYIKAYELAINLPEENPVRQSFNIPHQLPDFNSAVLQFEPKEVETQLVPIRFNVDDWGSSSNIEISSKENGEKIPHTVKRAARSTVRSAAYRPAIANGQPIDSVGVTQTVVVEL